MVTLLHTLKHPIQLLKESFQVWWRSRASQKGAAIAYFSLFSLVPLLYIVVSVTSVAFRRRDVLQWMSQWLSGEILRAVEEFSQVGTSPIGIVIGLGAIYVGASAVVQHIQTALDELWEYQPNHHRIERFVRRRLLSLLIITAIAALVFVSLVASAFMSHIRQSLDLSFPPFVWLLNNGALFLFVLFFLALLYRVLSHGKMPRKSIWLGAVVSSLLMLLGKYVLSVYFSHAHLLSFFGAARTFILIMVWFYYLAQIFLFGGALVKVHAKKTNRDGKLPHRGLL